MMTSQSSIIRALIDACEGLEPHETSRVLRCYLTTQDACAALMLARDYHMAFVRERVGRVIRRVMADMDAGRYRHVRVFPAPEAAA